jgi:4-amino-4-deoxy-L-arabinose transferase-like glycosyltransferase
MSDRPWTRWHTYATAVLLALAAFVQFSVVQQTRHDGVIHGDAVKYVFYAYNLKAHHVFSKQQTFGTAHDAAQPIPDKLTLPGYPAFLSLFIDGTPDRGLVKHVTQAQAALGVISVLLAFLIALRLMPLGWAFATAAIVAIQPHLAVVDTYLMTESLFTPLMLASVLAILLAMQPNAKSYRYILAGLFVGLASLVRPQMELLPFVALAIALLFRAARPRLKGICLGLACFLLVFGPWQLRNVGTERPQGDPDLLVTTLYHGSFPGFMYHEDPRTLGYAYRADPENANATRDLPSVLKRIGRDFAREPGKYALWYLFGKPYYFLSWGIITGDSDLLVYPVEYSPYQDKPVFVAMRAASHALHWPLVMLSLIAMLVGLWRPGLLAGNDLGRRNALTALSTICVYLIVLHAIGSPYPRYGIPFRPLFFALAMAGLAAIGARTGRRDQS